MSTFEISKGIVDKLKVQTKFEPEMVLSSLNCWFKGHEQIRCPFPTHMHDKLPDLAVIKFIEWTDQLSDKAREEINDEILLEKFEEILFSQAHKFAETEEEKLTIKYPFLVRTGDIVLKEDAQNIITERKVRKEGDQLFMDVVLEKVDSKEHWKTSFELPEY
jgi:hypothetical protein